MRRPRPALLSTAALLLVACAAGLHAQAAAGPPALDPNRIQVTRAELGELLRQYEEAESSGSYSASFRDRARSHAAMLRARLRDGDFRVGDQVVLAVQGETPLSATFPVQAGPVIVLPEIGAIPLQGVLRSELEPHLRAQLARYLREPQVRAYSLFRIMVSGAVGRAGYYLVPAESLVSDAIMSAGGFAAGADLGRVRVLRGDAVVWSGEELREAIAAGSTFDQLNLTAGDHLEVPTQRPSGAFGGLRAALVGLAPILISLAALTRLL